MLSLRWSYVLVALCVLTVCVWCSAKSQCDICKDLISNFKKGLEKTVKSNFGGGNTNWEEKSLGKWKTSETRLVEIVEHHICVDNEKQCHMFYEHNEESIEDWYFNVYKDLDSADGLHDHLCIEASKACCPEGKYGKDCKDCPSVNGQICGSHGNCAGDGTRSGKGTCECHSGYDGSLCDACEDNFYEQLTGTVLVCRECDVTCEDTCTGAGPKGCDECGEGYTWDDSLGCKDDNECADVVSPCESSARTYCVNTAGSYKCDACHSSCNACVGSQSPDCTECVTGYEKATPDAETASCLDIDECAVKPELCGRIQGAVCYNTDGSFDCRCKEDNQKIEGDECIDIVEPVAAEQPPEETVLPPKESTEKSDKGKKSKSKSKSSKTKPKPKPSVNTDSGKPKIDVDAMMNEAGKLPPGQKRKYRTLDTMTLSSATGLYLVMCLVFKAEFFKTSLVTMFYAIFIYLYSAQYV